MKTRFLLLTLSLCSFMASAQKGSQFIVKGKIGNYNSPAKIYLDYAVDNKEYTDSATLKDGVYKFTGKIHGTAQAYIALNRQGGGLNFDDNKSFYLEAGVNDISAKDSAKNAIVTGTKTNRDNDRYVAMVKPAGDQIISFQKEKASLTPEQQKDEALMKRYDDRETALNDVYAEAKKKFIRENPSSFVSLAKLVGFSYGREYSEIMPLYNNLSPALKSTGDGKFLARMVQHMKAVQLGAIAPDFTQPDTTGTPVSLKSFRGKYVLVDFWASWCHPCRAENPNLVKAFNHYKGNSLAILSISLDTKGAKDTWLQAINSDGMLWTQVSDLSGWNNTVAKEYGVTAIPQNFLVDPQGKIVAKNLRGDGLEKKLKTIFGI